MDFNQFAKMCQVWHMGDFWQVRVNTTVKGLYPIQSYSNDITSTKSQNQLWECMKYVSDKITTPIRWSSSRGDIPIVWTTKGLLGCPYGPDLYGGDEGIYRNLTPITHPFNRLSFNPRNGAHEIHWDTSPTGNMVCRHSQARCSQSVITEYNSKITTYDDLKVRHPSMRDLSIIENKPVQYYSAIIQHDINMSTFHSTPTQITDHHNDQFDIDVVEQGHLSSDGILRLVRFVRERVLHWGSVRSGYNVINPYHRQDGPAEVTLYGVKDTIVGDVFKTTHTGNRHEHKWYLHGQQITQMNIDKWVKQHGAIVREGHHGYQSAFPNDMDRMAFIANPPS